MWPEKWPIEWLLSVRHTRSFAKNYLNDPMGRDGDYWTSDDFTYSTLGAEATRWILQLDPAVTTKGTSDYTGWAVVAYRPTGKPIAEVVASGKIRLTGEPLRAWVLAKLQEFERIKAVRVEVNQGGELWYTVLHHLPAKLIVHTSNESKEVRFAYALDLYQRGHVLHRERQRELEEQMVSFPKAPYDDIADAAVCGVLFFLSNLPKVRSYAESRSYA
jgi:phage terminase large subunit-like protein